MSNEFDEINQVTHRIVNRDLPFIGKLMDELKERQPFMLSVILGYTVDLKREEAEDLLIIHLVIWWKYRKNKSCLITPVSEALHTKAMDRNIAFFKYLEKEDGTTMFSRVISDDFKNKNHLVLMGYINLLFQKWPALLHMEQQEKGIVILSIKSFVECFEEISKKV